MSRCLLGPFAAAAIQIRRRAEGSTTAPFGKFYARLVPKAASPMILINNVFISCYGANSWVPYLQLNLELTKVQGKTTLAFLSAESGFRCLGLFTCLKFQHMLKCFAGSGPSFLLRQISTQNQ